MGGNITLALTTSSRFLSLRRRRCARTGRTKTWRPFDRILPRRGPGAAHGNVHYAMAREDVRVAVRHGRSDRWLGRWASSLHGLGRGTAALDATHHNWLSIHHRPASRSILIPANATANWIRLSRFTFQPVQVCPLLAEPMDEGPPQILIFEIPDVVPAFQNCFQNRFQFQSENLFCFEHLDPDGSC